MKRIFVFIAAISIMLLLSCSEKIYIPDYNTAKEQYEFAKEEKDSYKIIVNKEKKRLKYERVVLAFDKVLQKFPEDKEYRPLALISIGDCYRSIDKYDKAAKSYEEALTLFGDVEDIKPFALYGAAICYDKLKDFERSQLYYKTIIDSYSNNSKSAIRDIVRKAKANYSKIKVK